MNQKQFLDILKQASKLKTNTRHCWTDTDRKESIADHSWRIALMAMLLGQEEEFQAIDMNRVIRMCLIHDLGESFTGDIPTFIKTEENADDEDALFRHWVNSFSDKQKEEWNALLDEMDAQESLESKTWKALDKLEALISHNESDIETWLPLEYDLQYTHGVEQIQFSEYLKELKKEIDDWTTEKINEGKHHD